MGRAQGACFVARTKLVHVLTRQDAQPGITFFGEKLDDQFDKCELSSFPLAL